MVFSPPMWQSKYLRDLSPGLACYPISSHLGIISFPFDRNICHTIISDWRSKSFFSSLYEISMSDYHILSIAGLFVYSSMH